MSQFQYMTPTPDNQAWSRDSFKQRVNQVFERYDQDTDGLDADEFSRFVKSTWNESGLHPINQRQIGDVFVNFSGVPDQGNPEQDQDFATISKPELASMLMTMDSQQLPPFHKQSDDRASNRASNGIVERDEFEALALPSLPNWSPIDTYLTAYEGTKNNIEPIFGENPEAAIVDARKQQHFSQQTPVNAQNLLTVPQHKRSTAREILGWQTLYNNRQLGRAANAFRVSGGTCDKPFTQFLPQRLQEELRTLFNEN